MSATAKCACGKPIVSSLPDSNELGARLVRAFARRRRHCDDCLAKVEAQEAERERVEQREGRRERSHLPNRLRGELLADFPAKPGQGTALVALVEWASTKDAGGLMLVGETGVGKTRLAASACWTRLEHFPCTYISVARAMAALGASFTDESRARAVRAFTGSSAVVLDDLDKSRPTDFGCEQIFSAVDAREQAGAPLLVTTNLTPSEIGKRYGEPLMSRLAGYCRTIRVDGEDYRVAV